MNEKLGFKKAYQNIHLFRHMRISDESGNPNMTYAEREKLSKEMMHSLFTADDYVRQTIRK